MTPPHTHSPSLPKLLVVAACLLAVCQLVLVAMGLHAVQEGRIDLRAFYAAGAILREGHGSQLYSYELQKQVQDALVAPRADALPFLYPAFAALPFVPLSLLPYAVAWKLWMLLNAVLLILAAALLARPPGLPWRTLLLFFACIFGVSVAFIQGQISFALLLVFIAAWRLQQRHSDFTAGCVLALALMKFQIALPAVLLLVFWRQWRLVAGFATGAVMLIGASLALIGRQGAALYLHSMTTMTAQTAVNAAGAKTHYGMYPTDMPNLHGLLFALSHGARWGLLLTALLSLAVLLWAARHGRSLVVALPAAMLVSYHMQPHDLTLLLLPLSLITRSWLEGCLPRASALVFAGSLALLVLPVAGALMVTSSSCVAALAVCGVMYAVARAELSTKGSPKAA